MFTEEDKAYVAEMKEKGREHMGIKKVARGIEDEIIKVRESVLRLRCLFFSRHAVFCFVFARALRFRPYD